MPAFPSVVYSSVVPRILPFSFHCRELYHCAREVLQKHGKEDLLTEAIKELVGTFPETIELFNEEEDL